MKNFNYKRAFDEWALPGFEKLSQEIKTLYADVGIAYEHIVQNDDLSLPWDPDLKRRFDAVDPVELAKAGNIIASCGGWDYVGAKEWPRGPKGTHWKFEILCKQSLIARGFREYLRYAIFRDAYMEETSTPVEIDKVVAAVKAAFLPLFTVVSVATVENGKGEKVCFLVVRRVGKSVATEPTEEELAKIRELTPMLRLLEVEGVAYIA